MFLINYLIQSIRAWKSEKDPVHFAYCICSHLMNYRVLLDAGSLPSDAIRVRGGFCVQTVDSLRSREYA
jgi:hypothetical protein